MTYDIPSSGSSALSRGEAAGGGIIADGANEVLKRSREQLMLGATQLKLAAGGGVLSSYDPIDVSQYTEEEFRAAVSAAENLGNLCFGACLHAEINSNRFKRRSQNH